MKQIFTFLMIACSTAAFAQNHDQAIKAVYGNATSQLSAEQRLWLENCLSRCSVVTEPGENTYKNIREISVNQKFDKDVQAATSVDPESFNPLIYNIDFFKEEEQKFRLFNSNYVLVVAPKN